MYNFPHVRIVEFEISADELDHLLFLNFINDLPGKGLRGPYYRGPWLGIVKRICFLPFFLFLNFINDLPGKGLRGPYYRGPWLGIVKRICFLPFFFIFKKRPFPDIRGFGKKRVSLSVVRQDRCAK